MTPERFWQLVDTLGGVADDETCARLHDLLIESGEGEAFGEVLDELVETLLAQCRWPAEVRGSDAASWVAAAVVAAGRDAHDAVLVRREIDLEQWHWDEAEALLVAGFDQAGVAEGHGPPDDHGAPVPPVAVTLQWLSVPSPPRLRTAHDRGPVMVIDLGDDPALGQRPVHDPDWVEARSVLAADASVLERRRRVDHLDLWLTVRPAVPAGEPVPDPATHSPFDGYRAVREAYASRFETGDRASVVLVVPASDFPDGERRVDAYVSAVHRLLEAAGA